MFCLTICKPPHILLSVSYSILLKYYFLSIYPFSFFSLPQPSFLPSHKLHSQPNHNPLSNQIKSLINNQMSNKKSEESV